MKSSDVLRRWSIADSLETYAIRNWGAGFFNINDKGNLSVSPAGEDASREAIDLKELVDELAQRGISLPLLLRFNDVLKTRITTLNECFRKAIAEYGYKASYKGVYPIKVNQHKYVV